MCPAAHTVAKRMRLIVSGLVKLSSSFIFRAQISAFSVCLKKAFARLSNLPNESFQSARNYLTLPRHDLQRKTKKSQAPPSPSPFSDSAGQKYHLQLSHRLLICNSCGLFNVTSEQVQQGRAQQCPEHTQENQGQHQSCCLATNQ